MIKFELGLIAQGQVQFRCLAFVQDQNPDLSSQLVVFLCLFQIFRIQDQRGLLWCHVQG